MENEVIATEKREYVKPVVDEVELVVEETVLNVSLDTIEEGCTV
jgi:hypothetical protein